MAEEKGTYKSIGVNFYEAGLGHGLQVDLDAHPNISSAKWSFRVSDQSRKTVWVGDLRGLVELVCLGLVYKDRLEKEAKEGMLCEETSASTPKTLAGEQDKAGDTEIPF